MKGIAAIIIGNAIIWGAVMIACSMALEGTGAFQEIQTILAAGAGVSLLLVGGLSAEMKKKSKEASKPEA